MALASEGTVTSQVEQQTSKLPSMTWLGLAVGSMCISAALVLAGKKELGNFIGQWAPSLLIIGVYNKIAKELAVPQPQRRIGAGGVGYSPTTSSGIGSGLGAH